MITISVIILSIALVSSTNPEVCTPNSFYRIECNSCRCTQDGSAAVCTQWTCPPGLFNPDGSFAVPIDVIEQIIPNVSEIEITPSVGTTGSGLSFSGQVCTPNAYFYKGCNECWCSSLGNSYYCIDKKCPSNVVPREYPRQSKVSKSAYYQQCRPGSQFKKDCNICVCSQYGIPVCTTNLCYSGQYNPSNSFQNPHNHAQQANPGVGQIEIIPSQVVGESHSTSFEVCTPGSFFHINCNRCRCSAFGETYSCTNFPCAPSQPNQNAPGNHQNPNQNIPSYPVPQVPNQQHNPPQGTPTFPIPNVPNVPNQQHNPPQGTPTFPIPNVPNQQQSTQTVPDQHHKHSHGCGHKRAASHVSVN